jgi:hypothetical protein
MAIQNFYTDSMDVYAETSARGDTGGMILSGTAKVTAEPCRVQDAASSLTNFAGSKDMRGSITIFTDYANIANGDYVIVRRRKRPNVPKTAKVTGINERGEIGGIDDFYVITAEEIGQD